MRVKDLLEILADNQFDAFLITRDANIYYYTGSISGGTLLITIDEVPKLYTSKLNYNVAHDEAKNVNVVALGRDEIIPELVREFKERKPRKIGYDELSRKSYNEIDSQIGADLASGYEHIWSMRRVKEKVEVEYMKRAAMQADAGMEAARSIIAPDVTEYEVAAEASHKMRLKGAEDYAFPFIVASGPRSAYPHAGVTDRKLMKGDLITIDMGARYRGYCTDITRTFILGEPTEKQREIYSLVYEANIAAFPYYKEGNKGVEVDKVSRDIIEKGGYGEFYIHGLGHGVGLEVHEPPSISVKSVDVLAPGNTVSNEPGIYIHGYGGVRIEDTVHVTEGEPVALTRFPKEIDYNVL
jgi:Xaa-Pro aminopeptidase